MLCATSSAAALNWLALAAHPGVRAVRLMVCASPALPRGASAIMPCSTYTDAGSSTPRAAMQHDQHCRSWSYLRALRESGTCMGVASHVMLTHPAEAGPLAGDKGANHRVAARAVAVVQPAVCDVQGAALDLPWLRVNKVDLSAGRTMAVQCALCIKLQARASCSIFRSSEAI